MQTSRKLMALMLVAFTFTTISCSKEEEISEQQGIQDEMVFESTDNPVTKTSLVSKNGQLLVQSLHLGTMSENFKNKKTKYLMNVSATTIMKNGRVSPIVGYSLNENTYWEVGSIGYWRADNTIKRSDSGFSESNHFEVLVYPDPTHPKLVDVNRVKLTWRSPELGLHTFYLQNVHVYYVVDGILITGSHLLKDKNTPIGVSISITPKS